MSCKFPCKNCGFISSVGLSDLSALSQNEIELQMYLVDEWIGALVHQKALLKQKLNNYSLLSRMLPREILSEIFTWACELGYSSPILLGHVSRSWRDISQSTPRLWRRIGFNSKQLQATPKYLDLLLKWIELGKGYPRIFTAHMVPWDDKESLKKLFDALALNSSNWRTISSTSLGLIPLMDLKLDLRVLETIEIYFDSIPTNRSFSLHSLATAPKVHDVRLWGSKLALTTALELPWNQIDSFASSHRPVLGYLEIFKSAPMLRRCCLAYIRDVNAWKVNEASHPDYCSNTSMPFLQLLQMRHTSFTTIATFLDNVYAPLLEALSFRYCSTFSFNPIASFITRSKLTLRHIEISNCSDVSEREIISLLEAASSIEELRVVSSVNFTDVSITKLATMKSDCSPDFLPNLRTLEIKGLTGDPILMVSMLKNRRRSHPICLDYADIAMKYSVYVEFDEVKESISQLEEERMKLSLSVYGDSWIDNILSETRRASRSAWWNIDLSMAGI